MKKGFTLIEVLLVIFIIGTLAAAGFSGIIQVSQSANAGLIKNRIINLVNKARSRALNGREIDWTNCNGPSTLGGEPAAPQKKVPEFYGIKFIPATNTGTPQKIEFFARQNSQDCRIEDTDLFSATQLSLKIKHGEIDQSGETVILYSVPFGQFSATTGSGINKIEFGIYDNSSELLRSFKINVSVGIPE